MGTSEKLPQGVELGAATCGTRKRTLWCFGIALALVALDLWSKSAAFAFLEEGRGELPQAGAHPRYVIFEPWFALMHNLNLGAAFGMGAEFQWLLVPLRGVALVVVSALIVRAPVGQRAYLGALVLILAGAAGNLYDNLFYGELFQEGQAPFGPVRDFIDVYFAVWDWHFPTFNIADSCITIGALLLIISGMGAEEEQPSAEPTPDSTTS
ncbi:MAG: signal peptidase II [Planctomycetota bacterium]|nr:signal peptidase II [Planctomycetota bacterium]